MSGAADAGHSRGYALEDFSGAPLDSLKTSAVKTWIRVLESFHAAGSKPPFKQVSSRNRSAVQRNSAATCGSKRPRCCPRLTIRPWRPGSMRPGSASSSSDSTESSISICGTSSVRTGSKRGSSSAAALAQWATTRSRGTPEANWPMQPRRRLRMRKVTNAPPGL